MYARIVRLNAVLATLDDAERPPQGRCHRGHSWPECVCNGLVATVGLGQWREGGLEPAILTSGDDLRGVARVLGSGRRYSTADVVAYLTDGTGPAPVQAAP